MAVLGGTGLVGAAMARAFVDAGAAVTVLSRRTPTRVTAASSKGRGSSMATPATPATSTASSTAPRTWWTPSGRRTRGLRVRPACPVAAEIPLLLVLEQLGTCRGHVHLPVVGGAIYGDVEHQPVPESTRVHPGSPYGVTKLAAERYVLMGSLRHGTSVRDAAGRNGTAPLQLPRTGQG